MGSNWSSKDQDSDRSENDPSGPSVTTAPSAGFTLHGRRDARPARSLTAPPWWVHGPLIGADLLHLHHISKIATGIASIGGAALSTASCYPESSPRIKLERLPFAKKHWRTLSPSEEPDFPISFRWTEEQGYSDVSVSSSLDDKTLDISGFFPAVLIIDKKARSLLLTFLISTLFPSLVNVPA